MIYKSIQHDALMRPYAEYIIARSHDLPTLVEEVNQLMLDDWMPTGGPTYRHDGACIQAMYRLRENATNA